MLGKSFEEVHLWLDFYAATPLGARHRRRRHHLAGIAEVRRLWGDKAAEAARLHVVADLKQEGWRDSDGLPADEQDYVRRGHF
jgi:hypothetical protein